MGVRQDVRNRVRTMYGVARYLVKTEGVGALARRAATVAGLTRGQRVVAPSWQQPADRALAADRWPGSLQVLGADPGRDPRLAGLGMPVLFCTASDLDRQQLVSAVYVCGIAHWPPPAVLAEARRLRQTVILQLLAADPVDDLPSCDLILVPVLRDGLATSAKVRLMPGDGQALARLLQEVAA